MVFFDRSENSNGVYPKIVILKKGIYPGVSIKITFNKQGWYNIIPQIMLDFFSFSSLLVTMIHMDCDILCDGWLHHQPDKLET